MQVLLDEREPHQNLKCVTLISASELKQSQNQWVLDIKGRYSLSFVKKTAHEAMVGNRWGDSPGSLKAVSYPAHLNVLEVAAVGELNQLRILVEKGHHGVGARSW